MNPINLGSSVERVQWENENELRSFPFSAPSFADGIVCDACVFVSGDCPAAPFRLHSAHVGPALVSVSFSDGTNVLCCSVSSSSFEPYRPYPLKRMSGKCAGSCSFGDVDFSSFVSEKPGQDGPPLLDSLVVRIPVGRLVEFVDDDSGNTASGDVLLSLPAGASAKSSVSEYGVHTLTVSMSDSLDSLLTSPCDSSDGSLYAGELSPIRRINGVSPNSEGSLAIVFS